MRQLAILLLLVVSSQVSAQKILKITKFRVVMEADSISVRQAFSLLSNATPRTKLFYEFWVIKDGKKYYRPYVSSMRRSRAFLVQKNKRMEKVQI
jgi:hypothetical protein